MRVAVKVAYDGTRFHGSQWQPDVRTVHGEVDAALRALGESSPRVTWAGRTDAGVSAAGNVAVFDTALPRDTLLPSLTFAMEDAWAWSLAEVDAAFEPRHASRRRYRYHLPTEADATLVAEAMRVFEGEHDFSAFSKREPGVNPVRRVLATAATRRERLVVIDVVGESFLWNQVRRMVHAAQRVAEGAATLDGIRAALADAESTAFTMAAPPEALVLRDVEYDHLPFERGPPHVERRIFERLARRADEADARAGSLRSMLP